MVEAAGVELSRRDHPNRLMAHDFRSFWPDSLPRFAVSRFTRVYPSPPDSTLFREI
jgi:hypothetical protein